VDATRAHSFPDDTSPDDLCIVYTGGTTGAPKAVLWRQADLCWSLTGGVNSATGRPITSLTDLAGSVGQVDYRVLVLPPMMHLSGLSMVLIGLPAGAFLIMPDTLSFDTATALALAQRERASVILLVGNAMAKPLADALDQSTYDLSSVRSVVNGAAAMSPDVRDRLLRHLPEKAYVFDSLGASESGKQLQAVYRRSDAPGGAGKKFATLPTTAILDDSRSRLLSPHETAPGWLASTGRLPQGYLGDAGRTTKTFPVIDGVRYATPGDRARHDGIGGVELLGRDAVTINSGGEKIYAEEVESAILACPGVRDAIVVGRPSALWGMEVAAVVSRTNDALTAEAIIAACAQTLARYKLPKAVIFVDEIYRGPNGKADYAWARARALSGAAPDGATLDGAGPRTGSGG
jgi:fatty-acyl-CoA synthase